MVWLPAFGIFNVRADIDLLRDCTWCGGGGERAAGGGGSCADATGESALKDDSGRTAPGTQPASASRQASQSDALPT